MEDISLNFGALKESILRLSSREFFDNDRNGVENFAIELNESPLLMKQYLAFKSLNTDKTFGKERLAERFINQTLELFSGESWESILNENERIRKEYLDNSHVGSTTESNDLYNAIQNLIESKCKGAGYHDIEKEQESFEFVISELMSSKDPKDVIEESDFPNESNWEYITKLALSNFNDRYSNLSESEAELVKMVISTSDKKKNYLIDLKEENTKLLNDLISEGDKKEIFESFLDKMDKIDVEKTSDISDSIISCFNLKESLIKLSEKK